MTWFALWARRGLFRGVQREGGEELGGGEAGDLEGLAAAGGPGDQRDAGARDAKFSGEEGDERLIGPAIGGRSSERDLERAVVDAGDGIAPRTGMHAHGEGAAAGAIADCEGSGHGVTINSQSLITLRDRMSFLLLNRMSNPRCWSP